MRRRPGVTVMVVFACLFGAGRVLAAEAQSGVAEGLLRFAPDGTWGVLSFDASAILISPAFRDVHLQASPESSVPDFYSISAGAVFLLPAKQPLAGMPPWCAMLALKAGARPGIEERLASIKQRQNVEGLSAYVSTRAALAFGDDNTFLMAPNAETLATSIRAWRAGSGGGIDQRLRDTVAPVRKNVAFAAVALPGSLADLLGPERAAGTSAFLLGATGGSAGLALGQKVTLTAAVRLGSADAARQAEAALGVVLEGSRQRLRAIVGQADERMRPYFETMLLIYDNTQPSAEGADVHVTLTLSQADVPKATQAIMTAVMGARAAAARGMPGAARGVPGAGPRSSFGIAAGAAPTSPEAMSKANLNNIGLTIIMYRVAHENRFPPDLEALLADGLFKESEVSVFVDPGDKQPVRSGKRGLEYSYEYAGALPAATSPDVIIACTRKGIYPAGRLVLHADGSVASVTEQDLHDAKGSARTSLAASHALVLQTLGDAAGEEQKAMLRKFYEVEG